MNIPSPAGWGKFFGSLFLLACLSSLPAASAGPTPPGQDEKPVILIKGGTLIDGTGSPPLPNAWILIQGERILKVGTARSFSKPKGARVLRAGRLTILPGLIDAHVHLPMSGVIGYTFSRPQLQNLNTHYRNLWSELICGVTLVRDLHMPVDIAHRVASAMKNDPLRGARVIFAGPILAPAGGYGSPFTQAVHTPDEGRTLVRGLVDSGAGVIKIAVTGRQIGGPSIPAMSPEMVRAIVEEAHELGVPVAAHVSGAREEELRVAIEAGVDSLEHMPGTSDPLKPPDVLISATTLVPEIRSRGITIVPTLSVEAGEDFGPTLTELFEDPTLWVRLSPAQRRTLEENLADFSRSSRRKAIAAAGLDRMEIFLKEIGRLHAEGVRIGVGTDAGNGFTFHGNIYTEISYLVEAGLTALEAIQAATQTNAELMRVSDEVGTIEEGKIADLLLVRGDPLKDMSRLREVDKVIVSGRVIEVRRNLRNAIDDAQKAAADRAN